MYLNLCVSGKYVSYFVELVEFFSVGARVLAFFVPVFFRGGAHVSEKSKYSIGVILPLSGIHQVFGNKVLQAIQLAVKECNSTANPPLISLAIRDSKGNPKEAEKAVEDLVAKEKVVAILGPLLSLTVDQAAKKAQQLKVPMIALSQKEPTYGKGDFVFQNALTPVEQVQTLAAFAVTEMNLRTFAIFYPNSPYGLHYKNLFSQEISRKGGKVLGSVAYHEDQTDFSTDIKGFFKIKTIQEYDSRQKKVEEFKAGLAVEGIFIPDTYDRAGILLSQMAYFDVSGSVFLGTNAWNDPRLISIAGLSGEKAFFVDSFLGRDPSPAITSFAEAFRKTYQREPDTLEAIGYDGLKFLAEILRANSVFSPQKVKEAILRTDHYSGASGLKGFGENGKAKRPLSLFTIKDGQIRRVSP